MLTLRSVLISDMNASNESLPEEAWTGAAFATRTQQQQNKWEWVISSSLREKKKKESSKNHWNEEKEEKEWQCPYV